MALNTQSVRTKLLGLLAGIALLVGGAAVTYDLLASRGLLRDQVVRRGRYIATNLAFNAKYGVLTEDKPLLVQFLDGAVSASGSGHAGSDVAGRGDPRREGSRLAQTGKTLRALPAALPTEVEERDSSTTDGEPVLLFRAPVTSATGGDDGTAAGAVRAETVKGGVEVAISQSALATIQHRRLIEALLLALALVGVGSFAGWGLAGRWLRPLQTMALASESVAKGDLTVNIDAQGTDEIGTLGRSLNEMVANLRRVADNIQEASVQVASSAGQISANARLINQGASGQAQAAEETSTSMEEMAASIQTVAASAQGLASYVEETSSSITEMGASIEEVARSGGTLAQTVTEASATIEQMTVLIDQMARDLESLAGTVNETTATVEEMALFIALEIRRERGVARRGGRPRERDGVGHGRRGERRRQDRVRGRPHRRPRVRGR